MSIRSLLLLLALLLSLPAMAKNLDDLRRETQIYTAYATNDGLRPLGLSVHVEDDRLTLTGTVAQSAEKALAERIARQTGDLVAIDNRITVDPAHFATLQADGGARSLATVIADAALVVRIKFRLLSHDLRDALDIDVDARRGRIVLQGATGSAGRAQAQDIALAVPGVRSVDNRIALRPPASALPPTAEPRAGLRDAWIAMRLKASLLISRKVDGHAIAVATSRGLVRLTGRVTTTAQREAAVEIARGIRGVRSVDATGLSVG